MTFMRRPRAFISYRHVEPHGWFGRDRYTAKHRTWVREFAHALGAWNIDVIWDDRLRELFRPHTSQDPSLVPFVAEASTLCQLAAQTFLPVLTSGYVERIASVDGGPGYGTVSEEWRLGIAQLAARQCEVIAVVREWPIPDCTSPPPPIADDNAWDFRFVAPAPDEVELLADHMQGLWDVERPLADMPFAQLISTYLKFCTSELRLPWPGMEQWGCDFERPRHFLNAFKHARHPGEASSGSQRDLDETVRARGIRKVRATDHDSAPGEPAANPGEHENAMDLVRSVMTAHQARHRKPFSFTERAPGGRASKGLYFGPTISGFSHA